MNISNIKNLPEVQRARYRAQQAAQGKPVDVYTVPKKSSSGSGQDQLHPDPVIPTTPQEIIESNLASSDRGSDVVIARKLYETRTGEPLPEPTPVETKQQVLKTYTLQNIQSLKNQLKNIDPNAQYQLQNGKTVTGKQLQNSIIQQHVKQQKQNLRAIATSKPYYIEKQGVKYNVEPATAYLYKHSDRKHRYQIWGALDRVQENNGKDPFNQALQAAYQDLSKEHKEEYGFHYTEWKNIPYEEMQYYPGGKKYIETYKDRLIDNYIKELGGIQNIVQQDPLEISYRFASQGGAYKTNIDEAFIKDFLYDRLLSDKEQRYDSYFQNIPMPARWYSSLFYNTAETVTGMLSLPQTITKLATGKQIGPDLNKAIQKYNLVNVPGAIQTGIGETVGYFKGESPNLFKRMTKYPIESVFATGGELLGMYLGSQLYHGVKVTGVKGLHQARLGIMKYTGKALPGYTQISYYFPQRMLRRQWVKLGTKNIDDIMGKPYHSSDTLTKTGLSFAKGKTPTERINWTIKQANLSRLLKHSNDDFLVGSSSSQRIGKLFKIKWEKLHELPSLSTAPYGYTPTRFYRFTGKHLTYSSKVTLLPKLHSPSGFLIRLKEIFHAPHGSYDDITKWATQQPKGSWGVISPKMLKGGPETEINIFGKTTLKRLLPDSNQLLHRFKGYQYYTKVPLTEKLTEIVPVVFTTPLEKGLPSGLQSIRSLLFKGLTNLGGSSYDDLTTSVINLSSLSSMVSTSLYSTPVKSSGSKSKSTPYTISSSLPLKLSLPSLGSITDYTSIPSGYSEMKPKKTTLSKTIKSESISNMNLQPISMMKTKRYTLPMIPSYESKSKSDKTHILIPYFKLDREWELEENRKMKLPKNIISLGYREREWKMPRMEELFKINNMGSLSNMMKTMKVKL